MGFIYFVLLKKLNRMLLADMPELITEIIIYYNLLLIFKADNWLVVTITFCGCFIFDIRPAFS